MEQLEKFIKAQENSYQTALKEIQNGRKTSHWMWFIFPQFAGLGYSDMAKRYAINNLDEAQSYLEHPVLGKRLIEISTALLNQEDDDAYAVMGSPDDLKLRSCMTLFAAVKNSSPVFEQVLDKFFNGKKDPKTFALLRFPKSS